MDGYQEALARIEKEAREKTGELDLSDLDLTRLPAEIAALTHLQTLFCWNTQLSDLSPIQNLTKLQNLHCWNTQVSDLSPIQNLKNLQTLDCSVTQVSDLSPIQNLKNLQNLYCSFTQVSDLSPIQNLKNLRNLICGLTQVSDLSPIQNLKNLQNLDCGLTQVSDLSPIQNLKNLQNLDCSNTPVSDLSPIQNLRNLQILNCSYTQVSDLSPIQNLSNLQILNCYDCPVTSSVPALLAALPSLTKLVLGGATIQGIPASGVLSEQWDDNCLDRLRAYFADLKQGGVSDDAHIKLLILGNGRVGKTQITNHLSDPNFTFDDKSVSTHGIVIKEAELPAIDDVPVTLSVWDFGGQDIYHGTHALFLNSPAILALVWDSETEGKGQDDRMDEWVRNYPLPYWLALAQQHGYANSAIIPVQSQCDDVTAEEWRPDIMESLSALPFPARPFCLSAKTGHGWAGFTERLRAAVAWMRKNGGMAKIGAGRERVRAALQAMQKHQNRLEMKDFIALCQEADDISSPEALLHWLHAQGTAFYRHGMFHDQIVLNQQWALDAIYALFDREKGAFTVLRYSQGRFTRDLLARLVWQDISLGDQELFISMMLSCGICFQYRMVREEGAEVAEYIAPDLLPNRDSVDAAINRRWVPEQETREGRVVFSVLHGGLIRRILSDIGTMAGDDALYWKGGVLGFEDGYHSRFRIEQVMDTPNGWTGHIHIRTQGGDANGLLSRLLTLVEDASRRAGLRPEEREPRRPHRERHAEMGQVEAPLQMVPVPVQDQNWFVSYAWGDGGHMVDALCREGKSRGFTIIRDKNRLVEGDDIEAFMEELSRGDRIFLFLNKKYLESINCMFELSEIWRTSGGDPKKFRSRIRPFRFSDATFFTPEERQVYVDFWHDRYTRLKANVDRCGLAGASERAVLDLGRMQRFYQVVTDILGALATMKLPSDFDAYLPYAFAD